MLPSGERGQPFRWGFTRRDDIRPGYYQPSGPLRTYLERRPGTQKARPAQHNRGHRTKCVIPNSYWMTDLSG
jgi:hypothetical protein